MTGLLLRNVEVYGHGIGDCRIRDGLITETAPDLRPLPGERVVPGRGGALIPGLADHHLHLAAMAAHAESLDVATMSRDTLAQRLSHATPGQDGWIRAVGYDDVRHGELDRRVLDAWNPGVAVRVQHRSGALWVVNSAGLDRIGAALADHAGIERDGTGAPTGRLWRADDWLRQSLPSRPPSLRDVGRALAAFGVTHVADATPGADAAHRISGAVAQGQLPQRVLVMGTEIPAPPQPGVHIGPVKLVIADHALPDLDEFTGRIRRAHARSRPVAVHCVTRTALAFTLAALDDAGPIDGDRIEHCAVADRAAVRALAERGLRVVTQPTLVARRGDDYWDRAELPDRPDLWRYASLLDAGVRVAPSSDAPYGDPDPWACLRAASDRCTPSGRVLGVGETVPAETVLRAMFAHLDDPGGPPRTIAAGSPADVVLLDRPLTEALRAPDARAVRATIINGEIVHGG